MGFSESLLGKKNVDGNPHIEAIDPPASLPGGEVRIIGRGLKPPQLARPEVSFSGVPGSIVVSSEDFVIARVPYGAQSGQVIVRSNGHISNGRDLKIAQPVAESLHPVANPAIDQEGNIYTAEAYNGRAEKFRPKPGADSGKLLAPRLIDLSTAEVKKEASR